MEGATTKAIESLSSIGQITPFLVGGFIPPMMARINWSELNADRNVIFLQG